MLYIVATPIGNLQDITFRALEILKACDFIIAENPRSSLKLLNLYEIGKKQIIQFAEHNEQRILPKIISKLSARGGSAFGGKSLNGALITDAGTPGISDPGFRLVRECVKENIAVVPIPGPSAVTAALSAAGLPTDRFLFLGFLPRTENKIVKTINLGKEAESTLIFFDSPFRIKKTIEIVAKNFPDCQVVIARELTKIHEEFIRGQPKELLQQLTGENTKGEFTILISFK